MALKSKIRELDLADLGIKLRTDAMARLETENAHLREAGAAWYSNPVVWAAIGVIAGAYIGAHATQ